MDAWDVTKGVVAAGADEEANELEALADAIQSGLGSSSLESVDASCKPTNGKKMCIDFFIMNCAIIIFEGDCRSFNSNAEYESSRVQFYINPNTMGWEVKYNCSSVVVPNPMTGGNWVMHTFCDSAQVFNPSEDVKITQPDANGWRSAELIFRNNVCSRRMINLCLPITAKVTFRPNTAAPGGYELTFDRSGFPSMGVYTRNAADTGWDTVQEDAQKTRNGVSAIRALAGQIRSKGYNYPPPGVQPPGCYRS